MFRYVHVFSGTLTISCNKSHHRPKDVVIFSDDYHLPKFNMTFSPLKNDGFLRRSFPFWDGIFSGPNILNFQVGSVVVTCFFVFEKLSW